MTTNATQAALLFARTTQAALLAARRRKLAFWVQEFLINSDAIREGAGGRWRVHLLAVRAFNDSVEQHRQWGELLYLHDDCSLITKGA